MGGGWGGGGWGKYFYVYRPIIQTTENLKLEDLTVLKRSPDLLNNVKIGQDQLQLIMKHILFYGGCGHFRQVTQLAYNETYFVLWGLRPFSSSDLKQSNEYFIKQPSDF